MSRLLYLPILLFASFAALAFTQEPAPAGGPAALTADEIMARVAANQDRAEVLRSHYVYSQHIHVVSGNSHGKLLREETADYTVAPTSRSSSSTLKKLTGRYLKHGKYLSYDKEPVPESGSIDAELVRSFRDDLTGKAAERADTENSGNSGVTINLDSEGASKDGIDKDLFPLTSAQQKQYAFRLAGRQVLNKRSVYHIDFRPKDQTDIDWAGEAFIDEQDFQPVFVETKLSKKLPLLVRTMLGTDVPGIGFSVTYARQQDGVWFPSSFGTEFYVRALYFFKRNIAVSLKNSDFEVTHVDAKVTGYSEVKPGDPH